MTASSYNIPSLPPGKWHETELVIKRSRFVTKIAHAPNTGDAKTFIDQIRALHADATHNCWAYVAGPPGSTAQVGCSDDGEPHGTAGRPMLNVLLHAPTGEMACVVTRWFGGIKLGTGGLVRAYQDSVLACLETLPVELKVEKARLVVDLDYMDNDRVRRQLPVFGALIVEEAFSDHVTLEVELPEAQIAALTKALGDCSNGRVRIQTP